MNNNPLLDVLTRQGVLINVSIRYWRATKKLNPEDLGLNPDNVTEHLISLGHKKLLPKEALEPFALIESRTRAFVEASTFPFLNGLSRFLPNPKLQEALDRVNQMAGEFSRAKTDFLARYGEMRQQASAQWLTAARKLVSDPERLVATIEASFPDQSRMERYFEFSTQLFQIRVPESLDLQLVSADQQQAIVEARDRAARSAAEQIHQGVEQFLGDCVTTLRQQTTQLCEEMLESMRDGKTGVHQKTLNRLIRFIDQFKQLNFVGDQAMDEALERVRQEFLSRSAEEYRNSQPASTQLEQGLTGLASYARELAHQDTTELVQRFGALGVRRFNLAA